MSSFCVYINKDCAPNFAGISGKSTTVLDILAVACHIGIPSLGDLSG